MRQMVFVKRCLLLMALAFVLSVTGGLAQPVFAASDIDSGTYDGVNWRITDRYELQIGSAGNEEAMENSEEHENGYPWSEYKDVIQSIRFVGSVIGNGTCCDMFNGFTEVETISSLDNFDTENVTSMSGMFSECTSLKELDLSGFQTGNTTSMAGMFQYCNSLESLDLTSFDTSQVEDMSSMFEGCESLSELDVSSFDTGNTMLMTYMFEGCSSLQLLELKNFNTARVADMDYMFTECTELQFLDLSSFRTMNVQYMNGMFSQCEKLQRLDLSGFDTRKNVSIAIDEDDPEGQGMEKAFFGCCSLTEIALGKNSIFVCNTPNKEWELVETLDGTPVDDSEPECFSELSDYSGSAPGWYRSGAFVEYDESDNAYGVFYNVPWRITESYDLLIGTEDKETMFVEEPDPDDEDGDFGGICFPWIEYGEDIKTVSFLGTVTGFKDHSYMFGSCSDLVSADLQNFRTEDVIAMNDMFSGCSSLKSIKFGDMETSNVEYMANMFSGCESLTGIDLTSFDTSNVDSMSEMFLGCKALKKLDLSTFTTNKVTYMDEMFGSCEALTELDISGFNTSKVTNMQNMFRGCNSLEKIALGKRTILSVDPPRKSWTRVETLTGAHTSEPVYDNLSSFDGTSPGWYMLTSLIPAAEYTVSYNANGGSGAPSTQTKVHDQPLTLSKSTPSRSGYTFLGWAESQTATTADYQAGGSYTRNADVVLYAVWKKDSSPGPVDPPEPLDITSLSYSFGNTANAFGYKTNYEIPLEQYRIIFGDTTKAKYYYAKNQGIPWGGNCNGFASTSALLHDTGNRVLPSTFRATAKTPADLRVSDRSDSLDMNVTQFIEAMQVSQYTSLFKDARKDSKVETANIKSGKANLNSLYSSLKSETDAGRPVIVAACVRGVAGHALLAYKVEEMTAKQSRVYVYDSNYPNQQCYFTFGKNTNGDWNSWSYYIGGSYGTWGTSNEDSYISIIPYSVVSDIWETRGRLGEDEINAVMNIDDVAIYNSNNKPVAVIYDGQMISNDPDIYIADEALTGLNTGADGSVAVTMPDDVYKIKNLEDDNKKMNLTVVDTDLGVDVETTAKEVTVAVDDECNLNAVYMNAAANDNYRITLNSSFSYDNEEVMVQGKGKNESLEVSQSCGAININNCVIGTFMINGKNVIPPKTSVTKVRNLKGKKMKVTWKKQKGVRGYQIQYALKKNFKKGKKTVMVKGGSVSSKTIGKLKKKKAYYVRVRTVKTVAGQTFYSAWSNVKKVKIKK